MNKKYPAVKRTSTAATIATILMVLFLDELDGAVAADDGACTGDAPRGRFLAFVIFL
jgi:hypothetical protein